MHSTRPATAADLQPALPDDLYARVLYGIGLRLRPLALAALLPACGPAFGPERPILVDCQLQDPANLECDAQHSLKALCGVPQDPAACVAAALGPSDAEWYCCDPDALQ